MAFLSVNVFANDDRVTRIAIKNLGYKIVAESGSELRDRESELGITERREYVITRTRRVPRKPVEYYRFTVTVEQYTDERKAQRRVEFIDSGLPGLKSKQSAGMGFRVGKTVYVVSTDVYARVLDGSLSSVTSKFEEWVIDGTPDPID
jgi:hypothetical protein